MVSLCALASAHAQESQKPEKRPTVAVFVRNSGDASLGKYLEAFENGVCAKINAAGLSAINRKVVVTELSAVRGSDAEKAKKLASQVSDGAQAIYNSASMLSIASLIGADYVIDAQLNSLASDERTYSDIASTKVTKFVIRASYSLYEAGAGAGTGGGTVSADYSVRQSLHISVNAGDAAGILLEDISSQISSAVAKDKADGLLSAVARGSFPVEIRALIEGMFFPLIQKTENGEYIVTDKQIEASADGVSVVFDGVLAGNVSTTGGTFDFKSGIHKLRLERADLQPYERMVNVSANTKLFTVYLQMSDAARARWLEDSVFFSILKAGEKLTDAQVKVLEGLAETYKNSGFKVDYKTDTKEAIRLQQNIIP